MVLRGFHPVNAYLLEGVAGALGGSLSYCFEHGGEIAGILHLRGKSFLHLHIERSLTEPALREVAEFIDRTFPRSRALFGDQYSVEKFHLYSRLRPVKLQCFTSMELERSSFTPQIVYLGKIARPAQADALVQLQMAYEVEEVGASPGSLDRKAVKAVLKRRTASEEISVILHGGRPVAMAGVNARFEDLCQIGCVYVEPMFRGKGYGTSVVSFHLMRLLRTNRKVVLFVKYKNAPANRLYRKLGFREDGHLLQAHYRRAW